MPEFVNTLSGSAVDLLIAVAILIVGWIVALIIRAAVRGLLSRTGLDNRIVSRAVGPQTAQNIQVEDWIARIVFWVIMLLVLVAFLERLRLTAVTEPLRQLLNSAFGFVPNLVSAAVLILIAWLLATVVKFGITRLFGLTNLDERLTKEAGVETPGTTSVSDTIAQALYWFIFLLFLPAILDALGMQGLLAPVQAMINDFLTFVPNIIGAAAIFFIGWVVARLVRQIVNNLLTVSGVDSLGERAGLGTTLGGQTVSNLVGTIVYTLIMLMVLIAALNALAIEAISGPAIAMLNSIIGVIPNIFGAIIIIGIAYFVAKLVSDLVSNLLAGVGFNQVLTRLGISRATTAGQQTPSDIVGYIVLIIIMLFAISGAAELLGFATLVVVINALLAYAGQIIVAVIVFGIGLYFANLVRRIILSSAGANANMLGNLARIAIIIFSGALALRQTGIADSIVDTAFTLLLGAIAVAAAIAFGLGSRDVAGREVERLVSNLRSDDTIG